MGTDIDNLRNTLDMTIKKPVSVLNRMRLACTPVDANGEVLKCAKPSEPAFCISPIYCY